MKKLLVALVALMMPSALSACADPVPPVDYGECLAAVVEDHPAYTSYEPTMGGMSMSGGIAMPGSGSFRLVMHPGYSETRCTQWEFPEGRPETVTVPDETPADVSGIVGQM